MLQIKELPSLCEKCLPIVRAAGDFILRELGAVTSDVIEEKSINSLVSYVDKGAEKILVEGLGKLLPTATFLTEEDTVDNRDSDLQWIIDPLDGTTNFLHQLPCFAVSVGLQSEGEIVLGIVLEVNRAECFYAWKNGGAYLNGKPIQVSKNTELNNALLATGFPYYAYDLMHPYLQTLEYFMRNSRGIRRWGAAAVDLAFVACGRFDAFYEYGLNAWDVAAGAILITEAGGVVMNFAGEPDFLHKGEVLAGTAPVTSAMLKTIKEYFPRQA